MKYVLTLIEKNRPFICRVAFDNIRLTDKFWPIPYLSKDQILSILDNYGQNIIKEKRT